MTRGKTTSGAASRDDVQKRKRVARSKAQPASKTSVDVEPVGDRAMRAADLLRAGASVEQIAAMSDLGFASTDEVMDALRVAVAETYRTERELLDKLQKALLPEAMSGKWLAVDRLLQISDRRARLLGLEELAQTAPESSRDGVDDLAAQRARRRAGSAGAEAKPRP